MLKEKIALVTGSTSGIGYGVAEKLAEAGCHIVLNGFGEEEAITKLEQHLKSTYGVKTYYSNADMSDPTSIATMFENITQELGTVDIVVNNAGIQHVDFVEDFPQEKWDAVIAINLSSAYHTTRHAIPTMREKGWGRIINIASAHGLVASAKKTAYVSAKHGVVGFSKSVALETVGSGITSNAICPGWVLTPLVEAQIHKIAKAQDISFVEAKAQLLSEKQPSGEFVSVEEIGALAVYLSSEDARSITGSAISIDGGWTAQ